MDITIPVSAGHLIDQITILEIKKARIADRTKRDNVCRELDALTRIRQNLPELATPALADLERQLFEANERLWEIEDILRSLEAKQDFGERFVAAARSVYLTNDKRAELKRDIDRLSGSRFGEEKWFSSPTTQTGSRSSGSD